jgi:parallel beta-helix repeat protein
MISPRRPVLPIRFASIELQGAPALLALGAFLYVAAAVSEPATEKRRPARPSAPASAAATPAAAASCTGVRITPGLTADDIQQSVDANPPGTVFCFASGTYVMTHYIILKDSNQFICPVRRTCVLTGLDRYRGALAADFDTADQLIKGFVVEHFIDVPDTWPNAGLQLRDRGVIEDNETRFNRTGIHVASNQTIRGNFIHHNVRYGLSGGPAENVLIEGNELAWNNTARLDPGDDAGGSKIVGAKSGANALTWRKNHVHDNYGQGIWSDGNVRNVIYENNLIENNAGAGIDHEISWNAVIRNNTIRNNNIAEQGQGKSCWYGAQIAVNNSQKVTISGNLIEAAGTNAICLANTTRHESAWFPQFLADITVKGNTIKMRGGSVSGTVGDPLAANIVFIDNTYYVDNLAAANWVYGTAMTRQQWQAAGQDARGSFLRW